MKIINGNNSEKRDQLKKLEPFAREAMDLLEEQSKLISKAQALMKRSGVPDEAMGQNPFNHAVDLMTSFGKLSLELKE